MPLLDAATVLARVGCTSHEDLLLSIDGQLDADELSETFQVLSVQFDVIVSGALHPQWLNSARTSLVDGQAMREVNHFIFCAMYDKHRRGDLRNFVNTERIQEGLVRIHQ